MRMMRMEMEMAKIGCISCGGRPRNRKRKLRRPFWMTRAMRMMRMEMEMAKIGYTSCGSRLGDRERKLQRTSWRIQGAHLGKTVHVRVDPCESLVLVAEDEAW